jgi:NitT/TauT family transport system substrate-binding protein
MLLRLLTSLARPANLALAASLVLLGTVLCVPAKADPVEIKASSIPVIDFAPFEAARAKGFFDEVSLKIDTTPTVGGAAGIPALVAGQIQFAASNIVSIILAAANDLDVQIVGAGNTTGDTAPDLAGLVAAPGSKLRTGRDLAGKKIAVNARNNILWLYCREWVQRTGGDPDAVQFLEVPFPQMLDAVRAGRVDAAMMVEPFISSGLSDAKISVVAWPYNQVQKRILVAEFVTTKTYAKAHPDIIEKFVKGLNKGVEWANGKARGDLQSDEFYAVLSGYTKVPPDKLRTVAMPVFIKTIDPKDVAFVAGLMKKHGLLKKDIDVEALIHPLVRGDKSQ